MKSKKLFFFFIIILAAFLLVFSSCPAEEAPASGGEECSECESYPCVCCEVCEKHPCECPCEKCEQYPCVCCKICKKHPCVCCETCEKYPCVCCKTCEKYPCECPCETCGKLQYLCTCCKTCKKEICECCEICKQFPCQCIDEFIYPADPNEPYTYIYKSPYYPLDTGTWKWILDKISKETRANKNVKVDLSRALLGYRASNGTLHSSNNLFSFAETDYNSVEGEEYIVSLILPEGAEYVRGVDKISSLKNLKYIKGTNVHTVDQNSFMNCTSLVEADFPNATVLGNYAFYGCSSLKKVNFPKLPLIHPFAFQNSGFTEITKDYFPSVTLIAEGAFQGSGSLKKAHFSKAIEIQPNAFKNCTSLETAEFYADPVSRATTYGIFFHGYVFDGCVSLKALDIRYAWNVFIVGGALSNIGTHLDLYLFDDDGTKSNGHPHTDWFLGGGPGGHGGVRTINSLKLILPVVAEENSEIKKADHVTGNHNLWFRLTADAGQYGGNNLNNPNNYVEVTIERRSNLYN